MKPAPHGRRQWEFLLQREWAIAKRDWPRRLVVPLVLMPVVFSLVLGIAIPENIPRLLSFFAVLAVIWMGASLSILTICSERRLLDHERHLFLRIPAYLGSKLTILGGIGTVQVIVFAAALTIVRTILGFESLIAWPIATVGLCLVDISAVALGLAISALANRSSNVANSLLPLVMVAQIVFSSVICVGTDGATVDDAYGAFPTGLVRQANGPRDASRRAEPSQLAGHLSGLTLSRYGDVLLLSVGQVLSGTEDRSGTAQWFRCTTAICGLVGLGAGFIGVAGKLLRRQDRR